MFIISAFILGFFGSFHCIGMCGPIALTLPVHHLSGGKKAAGILLYNSGRISAYAALGMIFGWLGMQLYLGGLQQWLSLITGLLLLLVVLLRYVLHRRQRNYFPFLTSMVQQLLGGLLKQQRFRTLYAIGLLNGWLPCGLVYLGIAGAVATGDVWKGTLFMAAFGAGTLPAMALLSFFSHIVSIQLRNRIRRMIPVMITVMGLLLVLRGLNLGIPYISPVFSGKPDKVIESCCHKPS